MAKISVQLIPNAKENAVVGYENGAWKIRVQAPPVDGKANEALVRFIADLLDIPRSQVNIERGQLSRKKTIFIQANLSDIEDVFTKCIQV